MLHEGNKRILMFTEIGKLLLSCIIGFALMIIPTLFLMLRYGKAWTMDFMTSSQIFLIVQSLWMFLLPLTFYRSARRAVYRALQGSVEKIKSINLNKFLTYALICIGGSMLLGVLSGFIIEHLPESWGISAEDGTAKFVERMLKNHSSLYLVEVFAVCLVPAFVEELFFRATLQRYLLVGAKRAVIGIVIGAVLFSAFHLSIVGFPSRLWLGFILGWLYYKSDNIYQSMALHALNNFTALIITILTLN